MTENTNRKKKRKKVKGRREIIISPPIEAELTNSIIRNAAKELQDDSLPPEKHIEAGWRILYATGGQESWNKMLGPWRFRGF